VIDKDTVKKVQHDVIMSWGKKEKDALP